MAIVSQFGYMTDRLQSPSMVTAGPLILTRDRLRSESIVILYLLADLVKRGGVGGSSGLDPDLGAGQCDHRSR